MYPVRVDLCISDWFPAKTLTCMSVSRTITQIKIQNIPLNPFVWEFREQVLKGKREVEKEKKYIKYLLWAYRAPWVCAPVGARRARLSIALLVIWRLVVDLATQIAETFTIGSLTHHQPRLYATSTELGALKREIAEMSSEIELHRHKALLNSTSVNITLMINTAV